MGTQSDEKRGEKEGTLQSTNDLQAVFGHPNSVSPLTWAGLAVISHSPPAWVRVAVYWIQSSTQFEMATGIFNLNMPPLLMDGSSQVAVYPSTVRRPSLEIFLPWSMTT